MQVLLIAVLAFAAVWFVALRPKPPKAGAPAKTPAPAQHAPAPKSSLPGGLGRSMDKARAAKATGDASATSRSGAANVSDPTAATPKTSVSAKPVTAAAAKPATEPATKPARARHEPAGPTPGKVRHALARGHAVVLLFYSTAGSDDRAVRSEVAGVSRRGGKVDVWAIPVRGLSRFRNVLRGVQVLQTPSVLVMHRARQPVQLNGYTDRAEVDQVAASLLRKR